MTQARDLIHWPLRCMPCKPPLLLPYGVVQFLLPLLKACFWKCRWLLIGRPLRILVNIMSNENLHMPIGSNVRMTKLWDNKFWRSAHPTKLVVRMEGPSTIECVHVNGNLIILLRERITEHINIRRCKDLLYCWPFHIPLWRELLAWVVLRFSIFTSDPFSPPHTQVSCRWNFSGSTFCLFIYGRASLAMEGKNVVPMEITFMDNGGNIFV